jgi:poly(hydroxyalkanoate) depolymerase family esterase
VLSLALLAAVAPAPAEAARDSSFTEEWAENDAGRMRYRVFVPASVRGGGAGKGVPLVVALHGGNDSIEDTATVSGWNTLADQHGFVVAYPQEDPDNGRLGIWNWSSVARQGREDRAASLVALVTRKVMGRYAVDRRRVMVAGISAGAGMAVAMSVAYPELYRAVGAEVGCMFGGARCTHPPSCGPAGCETANPARMYLTAEDSGRAAYEVMGARAHRMPIVMSYGTADPAAAGVGQEDFLAQWLVTHDLVDDGERNDSVPAEPVRSTTGHRNGRDFTVQVYADAGGCDLIHRWIIDGMGHQYSGGRTEDGSAPDGPDLRAAMYAFLLRHTAPRGPQCAAAP